MCSSAAPRCAGARRRTERNCGMPVVLRSNPQLFGLGKSQDLGIESLYVGDALLDNSTEASIDKVRKWATYRGLVRLMDHPEMDRVRLGVEITDQIVGQPNGVIYFEFTRGTLYEVLDKGVDAMMADDEAELEGT